MQNKNLMQVGITANIFEWYQFCIVAFLAQTIGHLFFNNRNDFYNLLQGFSIFAISYLFRPLGSIVLGIMGDKYGTAKALQISMLLMAIPSIAIGLLPTFYNIGYLATILLILLRLIQGFGAGGELPNSAVFLYQGAQTSRYVTVFCSLATASALCGVLFASFVISVLHATLSLTEINQWGWRIPFLIGIPMSIMIIRIRNKVNLASKPIFQISVQENVSKNYYVNFIRAISLVACEQVSFYTLFIWLPAYLTAQHKFKASYISVTTNLSIMFLIIFTLLSAYFCSKVNYKIILKLTVILIAITTIPLLTLLQVTTSITFLIMIQCLFAVTTGFIEGIVIFALGNIFKNGLINSGIAISFTLPSVVFGSTSPIICTYFTHLLNYQSFAGLYITIFAIQCLLINFKLLRRNHN